jgi:hypothetical protein
MRFFDVYGRFDKRKLGCDEAAGIPGIALVCLQDTKTLRGAERKRPVDRCIGKMSATKVPTDEVMQLKKT